MRLWFGARDSTRLLTRARACPSIEETARQAIVCRPRRMEGQPSGLADIASASVVYTLRLISATSVRQTENLYATDPNRDAHVLGARAVSWLCSKSGLANRENPPFRFVLLCRASQAADGILVPDRAVPGVCSGIPRRLGKDRFRHQRLVANRTSGSSGWIGCTAAPILSLAPRRSPSHLTAGMWIVGGHDGIEDAVARRGAPNL